MKRLFNVLLAVVCLSVVGCKKDQKGEGTAKLLRGEFIYIADAAVLKGDDFIYGVELGPMVDSLAKKVAVLKREEYDMVPVVIMGIVKPNPEKEGWEEVVQITEIMGVTRPTGELATKIKANDSLAIPASTTNEEVKTK